VLSCTAEKGYAQNLCHKWLERDEITLLEIDYQASVGDRSVKLWKQDRAYAEGS
jgi:hypothetical protein